MPALTPAVFHILLALVAGERHGYGIGKEVFRQTDGTVRMGPGTIYGTLQRLLDQDPPLDLWLILDEGAIRRNMTVPAESSTLTPRSRLQRRPGVHAAALPA